MTTSRSPPVTNVSTSPQTKPIRRSLVGLLFAAAWLVYDPLASAYPVSGDQIQWIFERIPWMRRLPVPGVYAPG